MAKDQNNAEKYLSQKRSSFTDILFGVLIGVGVLMVTFMRGGFYYGPMVLIPGIVGLIWTRALKIKDDEYEEILRLIIRDADILPASEERLALYDIGKGKVAIGKDQKPRSAYWVITDFDFKGDSCHITSHEIDIVNEKVETKIYTASVPCEISIEEKEISVPTGKKRIAYVSLDGGKISFPVDPTSVDTDSIISRLKK